MKLNIVSDLHVEFRKDRKIPRYLDSLFKDADVTILAGDLAVFARPRPAKDAFHGVCERSGTVIYVPGNHEYYHSSPVVVEQALRELEVELPNLIVLRDGFIYEHEGFRFLGDTMWFPDRPEVFMYQALMNDPVMIKGYFPWVFDRNAALKSFLESNLRSGDIVVTHHLPSYLSTPVGYRNALTQPFYVSQMESLIEERRPALWVHGHTHHKCDYQLGDTRIVCNPVGYTAGFKQGGWKPMEIELTRTVSPDRLTFACCSTD